MAAHGAGPAQAGRQAQAGLGTVRIGEAERQCGTDVVELDLEPVQPDGLVRAAQVQAGGLQGPAPGEDSLAAAPSTCSALSRTTSR